MQTYHRVPPTIRLPKQFAGTHLYHSVGRGTVGITCLSQDQHHNDPDQHKKPHSLIRSSTLTQIMLDKLEKIYRYLCEERLAKIPSISVEFHTWRKSTEIHICHGARCSVNDRPFLDHVWNDCILWKVIITIWFGFSSQNSYLL